MHIKMNNIFFDILIFVFINFHTPNSAISPKKTQFFSNNIFKPRTPKYQKIPTKHNKSPFARNASAKTSYPLEKSP